MPEGPPQDAPVLVIDYDRFKQVNDQLGHLYGDRVLIAGTRAIQDSLENTDIVGRFGGEEFVVVLEGERARDAERVAEKLRARVQQELARLPTGGIEVTVSVGVALLGDLSDLASAGVDSLLDAGDQAMYQAKAGGRNRVAVFRRAALAPEEPTHV